MMRPSRSCPDILTPLPPAALTLRGGLERPIRASINGWILGAVPYHEFSRVFREGRPQFAVGEMWGKFVRSGCMMYRAFPEPASCNSEPRRPTFSGKPSLALAFSVMCARD